MKIYTFFDFCSGIGGGRLGLEQAGLKCVGRSETSRLSDITYKMMFNTNDELNYGNLKKITGDKIPAYDMLIAGFPCQTFSVIGRQSGFSDDRGQIIFHLARIINECKPKCFLLENVKGLVTHDNGNTLKVILKELKKIGYTVSYKVLSSLDYGVPQMRQRIYFIGFRSDLNLDYSKFQWPDEITKPPLSKFLIDNNIAGEERLEILKYYLNNPTNCGKYSVYDIQNMEGKIIDTRMNDLRIYTEKCPTLRAQRDGVLYVKNKKIYQLTGYEALLLQGFPIEYAEKVKNIVSDRHLLMQAGNAMTVNVIAELGKSIVNFLESQEEIIMNPGEKLEIEACEYLNRKYGSNKLNFVRIGGMDSTTSDIKVFKNNQSIFFIEVKENSAQSGQFVVLPNEETKTFEFSNKNKSKPNNITESIINYMNNKFEQFHHAGTKGEQLNMDDSIFAEWIIGYYKNKCVKYIITKSTDNNFIILPIDKFQDYFSISANYRVKKSGSQKLSKKYVGYVEKYLDKHFNSYEKIAGEGRFLIRLDKSIIEDKFQIENHTFYFSKKENNTYEIRTLSNTYNLNVIFSIRLRKNQDVIDLLQFEDDLSKIFI